MVEKIELPFAFSFLMFVALLWVLFVVGPSQELAMGWVFALISGIVILTLYALLSDDGYRDYHYDRYPEKIYLHRKYEEWERKHR